MEKPIFSTGKAVDQILDWNHGTIDSLQARKWGAAEFGTGTTITYSFLAQEDTIGGNGDKPDTNALTATEIATAERIMQLIEDVTDITFERVGSGYSDQGDLFLQKREAGYGTANSTVEGREGADEITSNLVTLSASPSQRLTLHEYLHALGLNHPGAYDLGDGANYEDNAHYYQDSTQYTIMSYWNGSETGGSYKRPGEATLMLHDVLAVQKLYGANTSAFDGNTIYGFGSNTGRDPWTVTNDLDDIYGAIWDTGGTDTLDVSGYTKRSIVDLREGEFSSLNGHDLNMSIVPGSIIENAFGGFGDDKLIGNQVANILFGNNGKDSLDGGNGGDFLSGGTGNDWISGGKGLDTLLGGAGKDTVSYAYANGGWDIDLETDEAQSLVGGSIETITGFENITGSNSSDRLFGEAGRNVIKGGGGNDWVVGRKGNDALYGGDGNDNIQGSKGRDYISGGEGLDSMDGGIGADTLNYRFSDEGWSINLNTEVARRLTDLKTETVKNFENVHGSQGNDYIKGTSGKNRLEGEQGDDTLYGLLHRDKLYGESGNDSLYGGDGKDLLYGGDDHDKMRGGNGDDSLEGGRGDDQLFGGNGNDFMRSGLGANTVHGGDGDDTFFGATGTDTVFGGNDDDHIAAGSSTGYFYGGAGDDYLSFRSNRSNQTIYGDEGDDYFIATKGLATNDAAYGGAGFDTFNLEGALDINHTIDLVSATVSSIRTESLDNQPQTTDFEGFEEIILSTGNDTVVGSSADETVYGGDGVDILYGGQGNDALYGGSHTDRLYGGLGQDMLFGGDGAIDYLYGGGHGTQLYGDGGTDVLTLDERFQREIAYGGDDADRIDVLGGLSVGDGFYGGKGNDRVIFIDTTQDLVINIGEKTITTSDRSVSEIMVFESIETIDGGMGNDKFSGSDLDDENFRGNGGHDVLRGLGGRDNLFGGDGDDTIYGGDGEDILEGGDGNDRLIGGLGDEQRINGGAGSDVFVFDGLVDEGHDEILRFEQGLDLIEISGGLVFEDLTFEQIGSSTVITWEKSATEIELRNFTAILSKDDFDLLG